MTRLSDNPTVDQAESTRPDSFAASAEPPEDPIPTPLMRNSEEWAGDARQPETDGGGDRPAPASLADGIKEAAAAAADVAKEQASAIAREVGHELGITAEAQAARGADAMRVFARAMD